MDQPFTTVSAATKQAASKATQQTLPFDRASATLRSLGAARLLVLGATALGLCGPFALLLRRVAEPHLTLLYGELELEDSAAIVARPGALDVTFRLQGDGRAGLVLPRREPFCRQQIEPSASVVLHIYNGRRRELRQRDHDRDHQDHAVRTRWIEQG
jgi:flagellar biosynthesis/type III secretory pathway M-ring protein FliF/YscJ